MAFSADNTNSVDWKKFKDADKNKNSLPIILLTDRGGEGREDKPFYFIAWASSLLSIYKNIQAME